MNLLNVKIQLLIFNRLHQNKSIYYVSELDKSKGVPLGAFGITDDPNELIHLALDLAERIA